MIYKKNQTFIKPTEVVNYLLNPLDMKWYTYYDWAWMIDDRPEIIMHYLKTKNTYDEIFNNNFSANDLACKFKHYIKAQKAHLRFCRGVEV